MTIGDFKRRIATLKGFIANLCKNHPSTFSFTSAFEYLVIAEKSIAAYVVDFRNGLRSSQEGHRNMVEYNLGRAAEEAIVTMKEGFRKEAHGKIEKRIITALLGVVDVLFKKQGLPGACEHLETALRVLRYTQDYDKKVGRLEELAGLPVTRRDTRKPMGTISAYKRPLAAKAGRVLRMHRTQADKPARLPKEPTGKFLSGEKPAMDEERITRILSGKNVLSSLSELPQPKAAPNKKKEAKKGKKDDKKQARKHLMRATA